MIERSEESAEKLNKDFIWSEKYRPMKVQECVLPDRLKRPFLNYAESGDVPNLTLSGPPGVGKTTIAMALANEVGASVLKLNSSSDRGIDVVRGRVSSFAGTVSLSKSKKMVIFDEADGITHDAQDALRGVIEEFSRNCSFILTCNHSNKLSDALKSRCPVVDFSLRPNEKQEVAKGFMVALKKILKAEGVEHDKDTPAKVIMNKFPDFRLILNEAQRLSSYSGKIDEESMQVLAELRDVSKLFKSLKDKNYVEIRKYVSDNVDIAPEKIYDVLFKRIDELVEATSVPAAVIIIHDHAKVAGQVANPELNVLSCLSSILLECEFKS